MLWRDRPFVRTIHRTLQLLQTEIRLLEADLGLCARCGEQPPRPLYQRTGASETPGATALAGSRRRQVA